MTMTHVSLFMLAFLHMKLTYRTFSFKCYVKSDPVTFVNGGTSNRINTPKPLGALGADFNQIHNSTSAVDPFRDLLTASPSSTAPVEEKAVQADDSENREKERSTGG
jgi:hypothetical protein